MTDKLAMRVTSGVLLIAFLMMILLVAMSPNRFIYDEVWFANYVSLLHKLGFTAMFLNSLNAAPGPLSTVVQVMCEPLTHRQPVGMRFANISELVVLTLILMMILKRQRTDYWWVAAGSVLVVPMTWVVSGMALSEMSAMVFVTLSLYFLLRGLDALDEVRPTIGWFLAAGISLGIAVWGRQPFLLLGGVPVLAAIIDKRLRLPVGIFSVAVSAVAMPLFVIWRGPLPPSQHLAQAGFSLVHGLTSFGYTGICLLLLGARSRWLPGKVVLRLVAPTFALSILFAVLAPHSVQATVNRVLLAGPEDATTAFARTPFQSTVDRYLPASVVPVYGDLCGPLIFSCGVVFITILLRMIWESRNDLRRLTINAGLFCVTASPTFIGHTYSSRYTAMTLPYLILAVQPWRQWSLETLITAVLGCGAGFLSLHGYFS